jgi:ubiquinone/menaquinone biosynthesis C-methylase UbiE
VSDFHRGFEDLDRSADEQSFFQFLDLASRAPSIVKYRERMLELCPIAHGSVVLDVGCGIGNEATRIASRVGNTGTVYGVDNSATMIEEARRRVGGLELSLEFQVGDAHSLIFEESSFDICRAERVLLYLEDPAKAIAEMARVTRPGGHVIVFDFDYNAFFIDSDFAPMPRHIETLLAGDPRNPLIGRELPHLMRRANLKVYAIEHTTLSPNVAVARADLCGCPFEGHRGWFVYGSRCRGVVAGARGNGARLNLLPCASRLHRCGLEAVACLGSRPFSVEARRNALAFFLPFS